MLRATLASVALLMLAGCGAPAPDGPEPWSFEVYHQNSDNRRPGVTPDVWETFEVHAAGPGEGPRTANVSLLLDGEPLQAAWQDDDGVLSVGDRFSFSVVESDQRRILTATWDGREVMRCRFGASASVNGLSAEEARAAGMLGCLQQPDDFTED